VPTVFEPSFRAKLATHASEQAYWSFSEPLLRSARSVSGGVGAARKTGFASSPVIAIGVDGVSTAAPPVARRT
jgi:hypothetical protein